MSQIERSIGILTTDADLTVRTWDDWLARATGIPVDDAKGKPLANLAPNAQKQTWRQRFESAVREGAVQVMAPAFHHYLVPCPLPQPSKYFDKMQQRVTIAPLREDDQIVGTIVTIQDVTNRREQERALAEQLSHPDEAVRSQAEQALLGDESEAPAEWLFGALGDESWRVRRAAVNHLAHEGGRVAVTALVRALRDEHQNISVLSSALQVLTMSGLNTLAPLVEFLGDADADLRTYAALALGELRDERAIPALVRALGDENMNVRYHAIEALGKLRAHPAEDVLIGIARTRDFYLGFPAIEALALIGNARAVPYLLPLLDDELLSAPVAHLVGLLGDEQAAVRLVAALNLYSVPVPPLAQALATLYERYQSQYQNGEGIADLVRGTIIARGTSRLLGALEKATPDELPPLAIVIGWLADPAADTALTRLLGEPTARKDVVEALVRHGARVLDLLVRELDAPDPETRQAAAIALGRIGDARAVPALLHLLMLDPEATIVVAGALAKIGDRRAFETLLGLLGHPNPAVRQAVVSALNSIGHPAMGARMVVLLRDPNPRMRESAAKIAGYFGYPECAELLLNLKDDPDENVRRAAIEHIVYLEDDRVLGILVHALHEEIPVVRAAAARAFAHVEDASALAHLVSALKDSDLWVRYFAIRSIGKQASTRAIDERTRSILADMARGDPANPVRIAAIETLGALGGKSSRPVIEPLMRDADADVARAASDAIERLNE